MLLRINEAGMELIKHYEGWRESPYLCSAARPTIGYGSTWDRHGNAVTLDHPDITEKQGEYLLQREVRHSEEAIRKLIKAELTQNMFSSLCSFYIQCWQWKLSEVYVTYEAKPWSVRECC